MLHFLLAVAVALTTAARAETLEAGLRVEAPWLTEDQAGEHVAAAMAVETDAFPAELMLAIAWRESAYDPQATPDCGVLQVTRKNLGSDEACLAARESAASGYQAGAWAFDRWVDQCLGMKRLRGVTVQSCALNGYAEGTAAGRRGWGVKGCARRTHCDRGAGPLGRARRIAGGGVSSATAPRS